MHVHRDRTLTPKETKAVRHGQKLSELSTSQVNAEIARDLVMASNLVGSNVFKRFWRFISRLLVY